MKIAFVEPKPPINVYFFLSKIPLLGPLFLGTELKRAGHEVKAFKEDIIRVYNEATDELHPFLQEADAVGFTSITHTAKRAYQIADAIKRQYPDKKIIFGGPHPSALPEEALQHADHVVVGEGEYVVKDVFEGTITDPIVQGPRPDINDVPVLDLDILQGYKTRRGRNILKYGPIMASRGCPHDCIFCSVTRMFGRKYRIKDPDLVMEEVMMRYNEGFRFLFFYDDNFAAHHEKTKIFLEKLIRADLDLQWVSQFSIHVAKDKELVDLLKRSGCRLMFIGVESINPEALKDYHKSQTVNMIRESIDTLTTRGLRVHSMFILGADSDNEETIEKTIRFSRDSGSHTAQFSILFPIPGTELYENMKEKNRIFINDWDYYDGSHSVILPRNITPLSLQKKLIHAYRYFFSQNLKRWLASRIGFSIWKLMNRDYMRYIRYVSRKLRKKGVVKDGILTFKGLRTEALPEMLSKALSRRKELVGKELS
jgi:anaerobic magnesium-protoporphyrin IX monomethyl ester cyclase